MKYVILIKENQPPIIPKARSPGKFEGELELCSVLWAAAGSWGETGIGGEGFGYYIVLRLGPGVAKDLEPIAQEVLGRHLTQAERRSIGETAGVIMYEQEQGFVYCTYYDTKEELDREEESLESHYEDFVATGEGDEDEDNPMGFSSVIGSASRVVAKEVPYG